MEPQELQGLEDARVSAKEDAMDGWGRELKRRFDHLASLPERAPERRSGLKGLRQELHDYYHELCRRRRLDEAALESELAACDDRLRALGLETRQPASTPLTPSTPLRPFAPPEPTPRAQAPVVGTPSYKQGADVEHLVSTALQGASPAPEARRADWGGVAWSRHPVLAQEESSGSAAPKPPVWGVSPQPNSLKHTTAAEEPIEHERRVWERLNLGPRRRGELIVDLEAPRASYLSDLEARQEPAFVLRPLSGPSLANEIEFA